MKLNPDCTRSILLAVENVCDINNYFDSAEDISHIQGNFTLEEIAYHARQCELAGLFYHYKAREHSLYFQVGDLTPEGHEFLANIRDDSVWKSVLEVSKKVGAKSVSAIAQVAKMFIAELIKSQISQMEILHFLP